MGTTPRPLVMAMRSTTAKNRKQAMRTTRTMPTASTMKPSPRRKAPHGGKLFTQDGYGVELTIFEQGVEPEFRVYTTRTASHSTRPAARSASRSNASAERHRCSPSNKEKDYLKGDAVVEEPHSFKVTIAAQFIRQGLSFRL
jgi:cobalt-zinc-cadmium efflux system membrane fusion protein